MTVLVTGATGFIGSHLVPKLIEYGHEVVTLHRYVTGRYILGKDVESVYSDLQDYSSISRIINETKPEIIINLAAISAVSYSYDHPQEVTTINYKGVINLAESNRLHNSNLIQFIQAGTSEEYGNQIDFPIKETAKCYPNSPYAVAKHASTLYLEYMKDALNSSNGRSQLAFLR